MDITVDYILKITKWLVPRWIAVARGTRKIRLVGVAPFMR